MATSVTGDIFGKEEILVASVVTGTLEQHKDLLNSLGDVDVRGFMQRTLLYVAVGLGKVDWVEGLLEKGANPGLRDEEGVSVMELAKGLAEKYPEDEVRQSISKSVRFVMIGRDSVAQGGGNATSTYQDAGMEAMGQDMIIDLSRKLASICESIYDVQGRIDTLRQEITTIREAVKTGMATVSTQRQEIAAIHISIDDVKTEMAAFNTHACQEIVTFSGSIEDVKKGITTTNTQLQEMVTIRDYIGDLKSGMATIHNYIDDVKAGLAARDVLLSALETSVTSLASKERPGAWTPDTSTVTEEVVQSPPRTEEEIREECLEVMMGKTRILDSNEGKVTRARGWYEKLYSKGDETACLLKFLKSHDDVCIVIDFDSPNIGRMISIVRGNEGVDRDGSGYGYFADFKEKKVYVGGEYLDEGWTVARLAGGLAQMSVCLAFNNGGRPYAPGDDVTEPRMKNLLMEAEEKYRRKRGELGWFIEDALGKETQHGKEVYLTSAVPSIIAYYGSTEGTSLLQRRVPSLLEFFGDSVMPALLAKAQV